MKYILIIVAIVTTQSISAGTSSLKKTEADKSISLFRLFKVEVRKSRVERRQRKSRLTRTPIYLKESNTKEEIRISSIKK
jgi:hypothetical protein